MPPTAPAGSPEAKVIGELMVAAGKAGQQYKSTILGKVETFNVQIENGVVTVEGDLEAKLNPIEQQVVKTLVGLVNPVIDSQLPTIEGDGYDWLCNTLISEGTKLQAS